jgi:hypothetical protein
MKLKEIFDQLTYGELSQLSIGGSEAGAVAPANYNRLLAHINLALTALYKRFPLKEGRVKIELQPGRLTYPIHSKYAVHGLNTTEPVRYIKDTAEEPFRDDIHKIERVYSSGGLEFGLNDLEDPFSMMTPTATVLRVPADIVTPPVELDDLLRTTTLDVVYRANHRIILGNGLDLDPEAVEVELPYSHLEPLLYFVSARLHTPTGMSNETNMGNIYAAKYEQACQEIETRNLRVDNVSQPDRLARNGWV